MTKTLLKKQMMEVFSWVFMNTKTGKRRTGKGLAGFLALYLLLFAFLGVMFYSLAAGMCSALVGIGHGWLAMALMGILGVTMGVFGSVFNTFATLYKAKDNDLLLSMPVPMRSILGARVFGVWAIGLMYELLVMIPADIAFFVYARPNILAIIFTVLIPIVLSVFVLALSCILGWVVACINSRLKNQKILTVIISLAFLGLYYYFCANAGTFLQSVLLDPEKLELKIRGFAYPLYHMGMAAEGNALSMLIFTAIILALFTVVYLVLRSSFLKLATSNRGVKKAKYKEKTVKAGSPAKALFTKELRRFTGSSSYMLNCGLGMVFMLVAAVFLVIKRQAVLELENMLFSGQGELFALINVALICVLSSMNDISAPSVSLEGKSIWLAQVLPVTSWQVLQAKLGLHMVLTLIPAWILTVCAMLALRFSPLFCVLSLAAAALFVLLIAAVGLASNLKMPNLNWTNETIPVKQGASVAISLFGGWGVVLVLGLGYFLLSKALTPAAFLAIACSVLLLADLCLLRWLKTKGCKILEALS